MEHYEEENEEITNTKSSVIPDKVAVEFRQFNAKIPSKCDTGATMNSLHADQWKALEHGRVAFKCEALCDNVITMEATWIQVRNSDGQTESRPVVKLDITLNGKEMNDQEFNLNNRSTMEHKVLIGKSTLKKGGFHVSISENEKTDEKIKLISEKEFAIKEVRDLIKEHDISFADILRED